MTDADLEALRDGLSSHFWKLVTAHGSREWGPAGLRYQQAVKDAAESPNAVIELQKVLAAQSAVLNLLSWPVEQFTAAKQQLKEAAQSSIGSRRGPGM